MNSWSKIAAEVPVITSAFQVAGWRKDQRRKEAIDLFLCLLREVSGGCYVTFLLMAILTIKEAG